jgi:hypothetical protein
MMQIQSRPADASSDGDEPVPRNLRLPTMLGFAVAAVATFSGVAAQAASIVVGTHYLLPNTPNQVVTIQVTGDEPIAGEDLFAEIGDGGTFNSGSNTKPAFTTVDILGGSIFAGNNTGATGDPGGTPPGSNSAHPLIWVDGTTTASGTVPASGLLASLTVDTTGLSSGSFRLLLSDVASHFGPFDTTLNDVNGNSIPLTITNGTLTLWGTPPGDYNQDGKVDAADYVLWRKTDGSPAGYIAWRANFGAGTGAGTDLFSTATVPEPTTLMLLMFAAAGWCLLRSRAA